MTLLLSRLLVRPQFAAHMMTIVTLASASQAWSGPGRARPERETREERVDRKVEGRTKAVERFVSFEMLAQRIGVRHAALEQFAATAGVSASEAMARMSLFEWASKSAEPQSPVGRIKLRLAASYLRMVASAPDSPPPFSATEMVRIMENPQYLEQSEMQRRMDLTTTTVNDYYAHLNERQAQEATAQIERKPIEDLLARTFEETLGTRLQAPAELPAENLDAVRRIHNVFDGMDTRELAPHEILKVLAATTLAQVDVLILDSQPNNAVAKILGLTQTAPENLVEDITRRNRVQIFFPIGGLARNNLRGALRLQAAREIAPELQPADVTAARALMSQVKIPEEIETQIDQIAGAYKQTDRIATARKYLAAVTLLRVAARGGAQAQDLVATQNDLAQIAPVFALTGPHDVLVDRIMRNLENDSEIDANAKQIQLSLLKQILAEQRIFEGILAMSAPVTSNPHDVH